MSVLENLRSPKEIRMDIAGRFKDVRLSRNISQEALSEQSSVTLATLRRFEQTGEISLKHLVNLAIALNRAGDFAELFRQMPPTDLFSEEVPKRLRARASRK